MGRLFGALGRLFRGSGELRQALEPRGTGERRQDVEPEPDADVLYKEGDPICNVYEVREILGKGGFGVVYQVYVPLTKGVYALKTFRDKYLANAETRERFREEAQMWADLGRHLYFVRAFVDEFHGRLYIGMEYIARDEQGRNSMEDYLGKGRPLDLAQSLRWAVQFCHGMEYAHSSKDFRCHRDIKPANILISRDKTVKITDLGLAGVLSSSKAASGIKINIHHGRVGLSSCGNCCGTPTHMPPEQFTKPESCDQRSDIYSFGIVLYQMAAGGELPFRAPLPINDSEEEEERFCKDMHRLHTESQIPELDSPLFPIIQRCLKKEPGRRYQTFGELRKDLEPLLKRTTGEVITPPEPDKFDEAWKLYDKGRSLDSLGRYEEAIQHYDKALEIDPRFAYAWSNKGCSLNSLGRYEEAIQHYDKALEIDPRYAYAWSNKGNCLYRLGRYEEAIVCYDKALKIDPRYAGAWYGKAESEEKLGRRQDAVRSYQRFIDLAPARYPKEIELARKRVRELEK